MNRWIWLILAMLVLPAACTSSTYQAREMQLPAYVSDVPASWYGNDPTLSQWYTAPYWIPEAGE